MLIDKTSSEAIAQFGLERHLEQLEKPLPVYKKRKQLTSRALKSDFSFDYAIYHEIIELDNQILQEDKKGFFPFIDHPFEIKSSSSKHNIDIVSKYSFIKVAA